MTPYLTNFNRSVFGKSKPKPSHKRLDDFRPKHTKSHILNTGKKEIKLAQTIWILPGWDP